MTDAPHDPFDDVADKQAFAAGIMYAKHHKLLGQHKIKSKQHYHLRDSFNAGMIAFNQGRVDTKTHTEYPIWTTSMKHYTKPTAR